jgi:co-chaperonin GroES (HSP10)
VVQILKDRVLVEFESSPSHSPSGLIIIPDEARDPAYVGRVIGIGPEHTTVRVDDRVVFSRHAGVPIYLNQYDKREIAVLDEYEILAVFDDANTELEECYHRVTYAIDPQALLDACKASEDFEFGNITYVNYVHEANTLYVTIDGLRKVAGKEIA